VPSDFCRDLNDIPVLGIAVAGECALLISVDRDLLHMGAIQGIPIIRPGEYWRRADEVEQATRESTCLFTSGLPPWIDETARHRVDCLSDSIFLDQLAE
jgi:hypothetical protein